MVAVRVVLVVCAMLVTQVAPSAAQTTQPARRDSQPAPSAAGTSWYRDGDAWVQVTRGGVAASSVERREGRGLDAGSAGGAGLQDVVCSRDGKRFAAKVGKDAVVQIAAAEPVADLLRRLRLRQVAVLSEQARLYRVESLTHEDGVEIAARLATVDDSISAIPDLFLEHRSASFAIPPNDPHYGGQWYLRLLGIESAWRLALGDADTKVAIIDTGCDMHHPDLEAAYVQGQDLVDEDDDPSYTPGAKGNEHGTACSGIVGAVGNNGIGVVGVCPLCKLICLRLFRQQSDLVPVSSDIEAFDRALTDGAAVVSNSWGFAEPTPVPAPLRSMIETIMQQGRGGLGSVVVFAAGNENRQIDADELGAIPGVLNVGAVNNFEEAASFSNFGDSISLTAPNATFTTDISGPEGENAGDYTALFGGTSAACPVVAGVAALALSADKTATGTHVIETLIQTARPALYARPDAQGHDPVYGYGMVDPTAAVRSILGLPAVAPDAADGGAAAAGSKSDRDHAGSGCSCRALGQRSLPVWPGVVLLGAFRLLRGRVRRVRS